MPTTEIVCFADDDGSCPTLRWLEGLDRRPKAKMLARVRRLGQMGFDLRRPEADFLRDEIYELRVGFGHVQDRLMYGFVASNIAILSHGLTKRRPRPPGRHRSCDREPGQIPGRSRRAHISRSDR